MMKSTKIQADSLIELTTLVTKIKSMAKTWCDKYKNYEYDIKVNNKKLTIEFNINKL